MKAEFKYLRKEKAKEVAAVLEREIKIQDNLRSERYNNAVLLPGKRIGNEVLGGVIDEAGNFVELSKNNRWTGRIYETGRTEKINKTIVYCGSFEFHWGHFLTDTVPRLWYALEADENIDEYVLVDFFGGNRFLKGNFMEFMELLGIADKVTVICEPTQYSTVIVPQLSYDYVDFINQEITGKFYSDKFIKTFDYVVTRALESFKNEKFVCKKKIFLTRSGLEVSKERDHGIEMIDDFFQNNDYQIMCPEAISLKKLIYAINQCTSLASIQGTISHNLLFVDNCIDNIIIIERSSWINTIQNDIAIMKKLNVTYIDANYCLLPVDICMGPFIYAYNVYLRQYIKDKNMISPKYQYRDKRYRNYCIKKYLENYQMISYWEWFVEKYIGNTFFMQEACNESVQELYPDFQFIPYGEEFKDETETKQRAMKYLVDYRVTYSRWTNIDLYQEFTKVIEKGIEHGKTEFLIYPFGRNGMYFKKILNERYEIREKAIFDNKLWKYNKNIRPICDVNLLYNDKSCFVLTSNNISCHNELLRYSSIDIAEGLFTF